MGKKTMDESSSSSWNAMIIIAIRPQTFDFFVGDSFAYSMNFTKYKKQFPLCA